MAPAESSAPSACADGRWLSDRENFIVRQRLSVLKRFTVARKEQRVYVMNNFPLILHLTLCCKQEHDPTSPGPSALWAITPGPGYVAGGSKICLNRRLTNENHPRACRLVMYLKCVGPKPNGSPKFKFIHAVPSERLLSSIEQMSNNMGNNSIHSLLFHPLPLVSHCCWRWKHHKTWDGLWKMVTMRENNNNNAVLTQAARAELARQEWKHGTGRTGKGAA